MAEAFRESISGPHFTVTVSNLVPGSYVARLGMVETVFTNAGQRVFDITCGQQTLARNLDLLVAAGGSAKAYFVTGRVDQTSDMFGSLTFDFKGHNTNGAELNTFELEDTNGISLVTMRSADLLEVNGFAALLPPHVQGPLYWKDVSLPLATRVNDLIRRMSLAEKVQQLRHGAPAIPRLGVPAYNYWNECRHGLSASHRHGRHLGHSLDSPGSQCHRRGSAGQAQSVCSDPWRQLRPILWAHVLDAEHQHFP
jgi:beta-glucosidase